MVDQRSGRENKKQRPITRVFQNDGAKSKLKLSASIYRHFAKHQTDL